MLALVFETIGTGTKHRQPTAPVFPSPDRVIACHNLPNPHKQFPTATGRDPAVRDWLLSQPNIETFLAAQLERLTDDLYDMQTGKVQRNAEYAWTVHVQCAGGLHRSVVIADALATRLLTTAQSWKPALYLRLYYTSLREVPSVRVS